ncbi:hypothetical protein GDO81_029844 [Engystomops pustulosus]|uniref:NIF3-like protein 1 n=1 Tax=Engystomops pustulosus TaxID=76066 RepID=A0AAV6YC77_ENGPU|nr:hypothetical protein GDO81_029844 [Engystomops pustulosus]
MGRLCTLSEPVSIAEAVERVKRHVGVQHLRLALGRGKTMGEMSHHEVLDATAEGRSVILCEHSNSERGYLQELGVQITHCLDGKVEVLHAKTDRDPLLVV